jgi:DNA repair exonuclease SbcCD ATPase subunit
MNKALHALVYVFLLLAGVALFFEIQLNAKRSLLTDRNRLQEDYIVRIAKTIEKSDPTKDEAPLEIKKDSDSVEAKLVDAPNFENLLEEYPAELEKTNLETYNWDNINDRTGLRNVYVLDAEGKPVIDGTGFLSRGSDEDKLLSSLFESCKLQQSRLNSTRSALTDMRGKLEAIVNELNKLKPEARQDKVTIVERDEKIAKLEEEKKELENQIVKLKAQIDELNSEITSLKDEVATAKDEAEAAKEEVAKRDKLIEHLKRLLHEAIQTAGNKSQGAGTAVSSIPAGDKGKIIRVDNENMFAVIEFTDEAIKQLKGNDPSRPLPILELSVKRPGFSGEAGEFVGRIKIRQEVAGKNYVICDILGAWEQDKMKIGDVVFAD